VRDTRRALEKKNSHWRAGNQGDLLSLLYYTPPCIKSGHPVCANLPSLGKVAPEITGMRPERATKEAIMADILKFPERELCEMESLGFGPTYMSDIKHALETIDTAISAARDWGCQHPGLETLQAALAGMLVPRPVVRLTPVMPEPHQLDFFKDFEPDADGLMWEDAPVPAWRDEKGRLVWEGGILIDDTTPET